MKLDDSTIGPAANKIAKRWKLRLGDRVAETRRAYVFKVERAEGAAALKIYKRLGAAGEGAGIQFLRNLEPGIGVKVYRTSALRSAVLMEWLEGETLDKLLMRGQEAEATAMAAQIGHAISKTRFRFPFFYKRVVPGLRRDFQTCVRASDKVASHPELNRVTALLSHLMETTPQERVLHGDLGFANIILTPAGPRLIDPKGFRADPAFEFSKTLVVPYAGTSLAEFEERIATRGPVLAKAIGTSPLRLTQWAAVVLAHNVIFGARKRPEKSNLGTYLTRLLDLSEQKL